MRGRRLLRPNYLYQTERRSGGWSRVAFMLHLELAALRDADLDLELLGFDDDEITALLTDEDASEGLTDEDAAPEPPQTPVTIQGDLWALGGHKVLCGDATALADVQRLLSGES